jgi:predicted transcriptional regulator of viral defense system
MAPGQRPAESARQRILELVRERGIIRSRDVDELGIPREYLIRLRNQGVLERPGRGLYRLADGQATEHQTLIEVCKRVPHGVVCLLSALQFHGLTTQLPHEVWIAIGTRSWAPRLDTAAIRVIRLGSAPLSYGAEQIEIDGATIRIFHPAKTVADCFKFRNKIGLDIALEALADCLRQKKATADEIWQAARVNRVLNVIRPYLESLA